MDMPALLSYGKIIVRRPGHGDLHLDVVLDVLEAKDVLFAG
jgi:hypothetical protein